MPIASDRVVTINARLQSMTQIQDPMEVTPVREDDHYIEFE